MKHIFISCLLAATSTAVSAQVQVTAKGFDLENVNKHKNWKILDAGTNAANGNIVVTFARPSCDIDKSTIGSTTTTTFKGLQWKIDKVTFDNNYAVVATEEKSYANTFDAIYNKENVYGRKYNAVVAGGIGAALSGVAIPSGPIDNTFMGTKIVMGFGAITGFKIGTSTIGIKVGGESGKFGPDQCFENAAVFKGDNVDAKEAKGQRWIPMFNHPIPNGGHILFNTSGVNPEPKQHYVFRKYDENAAVVKEKTFTFDYQCLMYAKEIEMAPGKYDYVFVTLPINYKKSDLKVNPANQYEYFRIDGTSFETKHQATITAPKSFWRINQVFEKDAVVYLVGDAGKTADVYQDFGFPKQSDIPNLQVAKIENGKLAYVAAYEEADFKNAMQMVDGEKPKPELHGKVVDVQMAVADGKFIYSGQQTDDGQRADCMMTAVFSADGKLETFLVKETEYSVGNLVFSKDAKTMYWLLGDVTEHNKWDKKSGVITAKESKQILTALSVLSYQLDSKSVKYQAFKNEEWGIQFKNPILYDTNDELLLLGGKLTKKAKDSELFFVKIKK
ncbi:MAG: hypothetical protein EAY72_12790 [Bacteroidetes bacterium]|nr:MAG: hypothetical protein EAY72_12790 [Bacteroidota bacterium]